MTQNDVIKFLSYNDVINTKNHFAAPWLKAETADEKLAGVANWGEPSYPREFTVGYSGSLIFSCFFSHTTVNKKSKKTVH